MVKKCVYLWCGVLRDMSYFFQDDQLCGDHGSLPPSNWTM